MLAMALALGLLAEPAAVVALPIVVEPAGQNSGAAIRADIADTLARHVDLRLVSDTEAPSLRSRETAQAVSDCGPDAACLAGALSGLGATLAVVVLVNRISDPPFVAVRLLDTAHARGLGAGVGPLRAEERGLSGAVRSRLSALLEAAGHPLAGLVRVTVRPPDAALTVAGAATKPGALTLLPGRWTLSAKRNGYQDATTSIDVRAGEEASVDLTLEPERTLLASPWLWLAVGAAVFGAAAAVAIATGPPSRCVCPASAGQPCTTCL